MLIRSSERPRLYNHSYTVADVKWGYSQGKDTEYQGHCSSLANVLLRHSIYIDSVSRSLRFKIIVIVLLPVTRWYPRGSALFTTPDIEVGRVCNDPEPEEHEFDGECENHERVQG